MENQEKKKKVIAKVICAVIAILFMIGIAFIVANYVHKNNVLPASAEVKNGLSAYELAVEQGYDGSLEDWLKTLDGKSAYEIAVENGYTGTEEEWNKAVANVSNQSNATITNAEFSKDGDLIITLSDKTTINVGKVAGSDGKNGANGIDGENGTDGVNGADGINGKDGANGVDGADGKDGQDGTGISSASVNADGQLVLTFSNGSTVNLDKIVGANGVDGKDGAKGDKGEKGDKGDKGDTGEKGADGKNGLDGQDGLNGTDGVGIETIVIENDELNITLSNGTTLNLGTIKGADGKDGKDGVNGKDGAKGEKGADGINGIDGTDGKDGVGISNVNINTDGELVLIFSDGQIINLGCIVGKDGANGVDGVNGKDGAKGDKGENGLDGKNGVDGKDGVNGTDGQDGIGIDNVTVSDDGALSVTLTNGIVLNLGNIKGTDGIGISKSEINTDGELVLTYTNGDVENLGKVTGRDGTDGSDATGIKSVTLSTDGELSITLTDNSVLNLGNVKGEKGDKGDKGEKGDTGAVGQNGLDGKDGRGIAKTELVNGELIITYTDGTSDNLQMDTDSNKTESSENYFVYSKETATLKYNKKTYDGYAIGIDHQYVNDVTSVVIPSEHNGLPVVKIGIIMRQNHLDNYFPTDIMYFAFDSTSLKSVTIPKSVRVIEQRSFGGIGNDLNEVIFEQPSGWVYYKNDNSEGYGGVVPSETLADPQAAAKFLRLGHRLERP